jgi:adenine-specific DNA-methyltransferase
VVCLAWEFEMDLRKRAQALAAETGVKVGLKYIPREIMEPNRDEIQFFDAGALEAEAFARPHPETKRPCVDVRLLSFMPALAEVPEKELEALRERAVRSPFDFIDFWAIDFEHSPDKPFEHHWQDYRTRKDRSLKTESDCRHAYETPGRKRICVKVIDVFGVDTSVILETDAWPSSEGGARDETYHGG